MRWFDRHIDEMLERWALGELPPRQVARLLEHARRCSRCGNRYTVWAWAHRLLEHRDADIPSEAEVSALENTSARAVLAAITPRREPPPWLAWGGLAGAVAMASLLLVLNPREESWQPRGAPAASLPAAVLRVFCSTSGSDLRELDTRDDCPPGGMLAFAAGAAPPLTHVLVKVRMPGSTTLEGPFVIHGAPGEEAPLEWNLSLPATPGSAEVIAVFVASPERARELIEGDVPAGAVVRRQRVRIAPHP